MSSSLDAFLQRVFMAFSHMPNMVTVVSLEGQVLFQNGRSVEFMGRAAAALASRRCGWV